ncbi:MAG: choice-of-anchor D domain-containing protein [Candidatus Sulfotelmatobacter sp.]
MARDGKYYLEGDPSSATSVHACDEHKDLTPLTFEDGFRTWRLPFLHEVNVSNIQTITLTGTGTDVQFTPTSLNFGNQPVGTKSTAKKITLSNKASVSVSVTSISITGTNKKDFAETNTCGTTVKAGASCTITVTFTPSADGQRTADVSVDDNGGGSPQTVGLSGTGTGT